MSFWRAAFFDEVGLHGQRSWKSAFFSLAIASVILAFPVQQTIVIEIFLRQAAIAAFALGALLLGCFALARALGATATLEWFFKNTATVAGLGLSVSFVSGWAFIFLGQMLNNPLVTKAAFSLVPFYAFALFGWGVEKGARIHDKRAYLLASISIALFVLLHFGLEELVSTV